MTSNPPPRNPKPETLQADQIEHRFAIFEQLLVRECHELAAHFSSIGFTPGLVLTDWWWVLDRH